MYILVIEDDLDIASNLEDYLAGKEHQFEIAHNGECGLSLASKIRFDLIILDLKMLGKNGSSVCQKLKKTCDHDTPILILTEHSTLDGKVVGLEAGPDDYLIKPFSLSELEVRISALVRRN